MGLTQLRTNAVLRWWFAAVLFAALVIAALLTTPSGEAFVGKAQVAADYLYYSYLSLIFKP